MRSPHRLLDLAKLVVTTMQERSDARLAVALADRAVDATHALDHDLALDAALVHRLAGDDAGALSRAKRALAMCKGVQTDCTTGSDFLGAWTRCPVELVEQRLPGAPGIVLASLRARPKEGTPPECSK